SRTHSTSHPVSPSLFFLSTTRPPPRSPLFPYTTLFRSRAAVLAALLRLPQGVSHEVLCQNGLFPVRLVLWSAGLKIKTQQNKSRSEEHTSELQSRENLVCRLLLEKKKRKQRRK